MYSHTQTTYFDTEEELCAVMQKNYEFWKEHDFPLEPNYAVVPVHSGVYPVHKVFYSTL